MNEQETFEENRLYFQVIKNELLESEPASEWTDNALKTIALLLFLIAAMSQWFVGYYAADYYDDSPAPNGTQLGNLKAKQLEIPNKNYMDLHFTCIESFRKLSPKNKGA